MAPLTLVLTLTADGRRLVGEVSRAEQVLERLERAEAGAARGARQLDAATSALAAGAARSAHQVRGLGASLARAFEGRAWVVQQVAFQLQDMVTQLSLGAPAAQVLAVQGSQLLSAFGPLATVFATLAGAAIGLGSAFLTMADDAEEAASRLDELAQRASDAARRFVRSAETAAELRRRFARLSAEDQELLVRLVRGQVRQLEHEVEIAEAQAARLVERVRQAVGEARARALEEVRQLEVAPFDVFDETVSEADVEAAKAFADRIEELAQAFEAGALGVGALANRLDDLAERAPTPELRDLADRVLEVAAAARDASTEAEDLKARLAVLRGEAEALRTKGRLFEPPKGRPEDRGAPRRDPVQEIAREVEERRRLLEALRRGGRAYAEEKARLEAERIARQHGIRVGSEAYRQLLDLVRAREELGEQLDRERLQRLGLTDVLERQREAMRGLAEEQRRTEQLGRQVAATLVHAFRAAALQGEDLEDVLARLATRLADLALQRTVLDPLSDALGKGLSGLLGSLFSGGASVPEVGPVGPGGLAGHAAMGAVVDAGELVPFARGGVVTGPTLFPLRDGAGLMGEAGPEAILPLRRLPDGRLGVSAAGGAGAVAVNIRVVDARGGDTDTITASVRRHGPDSLDIDLVVLDALRRLVDSGRADEVLGPAMGVRRRLV